MSKIDLLVDLLFDVLGRLPVKSLLRFRCVSKSWTALIDSPEFIKIQLNLSLMEPKSQKVILETLEHSPLGIHSRESLKLFAGNSNSRENFISTAEELYYPKSNCEQGKKFVGCCNGLLCIRYVKYGVVLCNPWTRKHKKLPYSRLEIEFSGGRNWIYTFYGFGYDDVSDDYKVVRLVGVRDRVSGNFCNEVKVYSLKSSSWRRTADLQDPIPMHERSSGVLVNCVLHWMLRDSILAIDLRTEDRRLLQLPGFEWNEKTSNLGVSNGCLCMWKCVIFKERVHVKIWLMKDYGIKDSWNKLTVEIKNFRYFRLTFVGYLEVEKQLTCIDTNGELLWYDIEKKLLEKTDAGFSGRVRYFWYSVGSLVQPFSAARRGTRTKRRKISWS